MRTLKAALRASVAHAVLSLAIAAALTIAAINAGGEVGNEVLLGVAILLAVVPWPGLSVLAAYPGLPVSHGLGLPEQGDKTRSVRWASTGVALLILSSVLALGLQGGIWLRAALTLMAFVVTLLATLQLARILSTMERQRTALREAIANFAPEFVLYTGRPEGGAYQVQQWLPQLLALTSRVVVIVRHTAAADRLAAVLPDNVPIICCLENKDLDDVMLPSVRAAFYVNSVTSNSNLVSYRTVQHVYLGHGDSDKEISAHPVHRMYDAIFVAGRAAVDRYAMQDVRLDEGQAQIIGRPQLEGVIPVTGDGCPPRTVLYCPTWSGYNEASSLSSLAYAQPFVADLLSRDIRVLFRPHPFSRTRRPDAGYIKTIDDMLAAHDGGHMGSRDGSVVSLVDLFNDSDAMVTDVSSLLIDYLASRKPVAVLISAAHEFAGSESGPLLDPRKTYPSVRHAYLPDSPTARAWEHLLGEDPLRAFREQAAEYYLGGTSPQLFEQAARSLEYPSNESP